MMLSEHKGALALFGRLSPRPGLPGHQTTQRIQELPLYPSRYWFPPPGCLQEKYQEK